MGFCGRVEPPDLLSLPIGGVPRVSEVVLAPIARQEKLHVLGVPVQFRIVVNV